MECFYFKAQIKEFSFREETEKLDFQKRKVSHLIFETMQLFFTDGKNSLDL